MSGLADTSRVRLRQAGVAAAVAAVTALGAGEVLRRSPPGGTQRWHRTNFRGRTVSLTGGPAVMAGAAAGALAATAASAAAGDRAGVRVGCAAVAAAAGAGAFGLLDDLTGTTAVKGLRGHLSALRRGEVTTGAVKIAGIGAAGLASAAVLGSGPVAVVLGGALVAGTANLTNLLDLRPGRALKVVALGAAPLIVGSGAPAAGAALGASLGAVRADLAELDMIGDAGANAAGAVLGIALAATSGTRTRAVALTVVVALTLASERVSFSAVIERTPPLRALDGLGRRQD